MMALAISHKYERDDNVPVNEGRNGHYLAYVYLID